MNAAQIAKQNLEKKLKQEEEERKKIAEEKRKKKLEEEKIKREAERLRKEEEKLRKEEEKLRKEEEKLKKNQEIKAKTKPDKESELTKNVRSSKDLANQQSSDNKIKSSTEKQPPKSENEMTATKIQGQIHRGVNNMGIDLDNPNEQLGNHQNQGIEHEGHYQTGPMRDQENVDSNKLKSYPMKSQQLKSAEQDRFYEGNAEQQEHQNFGKSDKPSAQVWTFNENKDNDDNQEMQNEDIDFKEHGGDEDSERDEPLQQNENDREEPPINDDLDTEEYEEEIQEEEEDEAEKFSQYTINQQGDPLKSYENLKGQGGIDFNQGRAFSHSQATVAADKSDQIRDPEFAAEPHFERPKVIGQSLNGNFQLISKENLRSIDNPHFESSSQNIARTIDQSNRYDRFKSIQTDSLQDASFHPKPEIPQQKFLPPISNTKYAQALPSTSDSNTTNIRKLQNNFVNQSSERIQETKDSQNLIANDRSSGSRNNPFPQQITQNVKNFYNPILPEMKTQNPEVWKDSAIQNNQGKLAEKDKLLLKMEIDSKIKKMMNEKAQQQKQQEDNRMKMKQNVMSQLYGWQEKHETSLYPAQGKEISQDNRVLESIQSKIDCNAVEEIPNETKYAGLNANERQTEIPASLNPRNFIDSKMIPKSESGSVIQSSHYDPEIDKRKGKEKMQQSIQNSEKFGLDSYAAAEFQGKTAHFNTFGQREKLAVDSNRTSELHDNNIRKSDNHQESRTLQSREYDKAQSGYDHLQKQDLKRENNSQQVHSSRNNFGIEEHPRSINIGSDYKNNFDADFDYDLEPQQSRKSDHNSPQKSGYKDNYKDDLLHSKTKEFTLSAEPSAKSGSRYREEEAHTYHSREELSNSPRYSDEGNNKYQFKKEEQAKANDAKKIKKDSDYEEDIAEDLDGGVEDDEIVTGDESKSNYDPIPITKIDVKSSQFDAKEGNGNNNSSRLSGARKTWQKQPAAQESEHIREPESKPEVQKTDTGNEGMKPTKMVISNDADEDVREKKQKKLERFIKKKDEERQQVKERRMQSRERSVEKIPLGNQIDSSTNEIIPDKSPVESKANKKVTTPTSIEGQQSTAKFGGDLDKNASETSPGRGRSSDKVLKKKGEPNYARRDSVEENKAGDVSSSKLVKTPSNKQNLANKPPTSFKPTNNKQLIKNALTNVCLSGELNKRDRELVFQKIEETKADNFIVVFKGISGRHDFRGLCSFDSATEEVKRVHAAAPMPAILDASMIHSYYRYDSGLKEFKEIPGNKTFSRAVDAIALHPSLFKQNSGISGSKF